MRYLLLYAALIIALSASNSLAQMDHNMMREIDNDIQHGPITGEKNLIDKNALKGDTKMPSEGGVTMQPELMMGHHEIMENMKEMTYDMSFMINDISRTINTLAEAERGRAKSKIIDITNMMRQVSSEMQKMADTLESGMITDSEMSLMRSRVTEIQEGVSELKD